MLFLLRSEIAIHYIKKPSLVAENCNNHFTKYFQSAFYYANLRYLIWTCWISDVHMSEQKPIPNPLQVKAGVDPTPKQMLDQHVKW